MKKISIFLALVLLCGIFLSACGGRADDAKYIYFGEFPQSIKADDVTITSTVDERGYALGSDGAYYAEVTAAPCWDAYKFTTDAPVTAGTVYYFKVEPIRWRVLAEEEDGTALLLCDSIIANGFFDLDDNNYANSDLRAWLNGVFYLAAFDSTEQAEIKTVTLDNSAASTGVTANPYACEDTEDKVFLLSVAEVTNKAYGLASAPDKKDKSRRKQTTDYARATGAWMSEEKDVYGVGYWLLRSPRYHDSAFACGVRSAGSVDYYDVNYGYSGIAPAVKIQLPTETN